MIMRVRGEVVDDDLILIVRVFSLLEVPVATRIFEVVCVFFIFVDYLLLGLDMP